MKIYAPVATTNGVYASVRFVNGVGETDNPQLIAWFKTRGYRVEEAPTNTSNVVIEAQNDQIETEDDQIEMMGYSDKTPDFDKMTPYQLRQWMVEHGYNVRNARSKEKLLQILRG